MRRAALAACLAAALLLPASAAAECRLGTAHDYAAPLAQLPPLPPLTRGHLSLPFGPGGLTLGYGGAEKVFLPGSERVRFGVSAAGRKAPARLGWRVLARLVEVDPTGKRVRLASHDRESIAKMEPGGKRGLLLGLSGAPGFYRIEIEFRNRAGRLLGRFGEYVNELAGGLEAALVLDRTRLSPGDVLDPRLDNGPALLQFGLGAPIEVLQGSTWMPASFGNGPVPELAVILEPGRSARCWPTTIPAGAPPGHYRVSLPLTYQTRTGRSPLGSSTTLTAEFDVVTAP